VGQAYLKGAPIVAGVVVIPVDGVARLVGHSLSISSGRPRVVRLPRPEVPFWTPPVLYTSKNISPRSGRAPPCNVAMPVSILQPDARLKTSSSLRGF
jgi:hypothetical protein